MEVEEVTGINKSAWVYKRQKLEVLAKKRVTSIEVLQELKFMKRIDAIESKNKSTK
ncbi:hypothetical protein [Enterococcus mundtii]|uniref:hypothetical protein n=1 Tax=Enterococcus mundtii TaxID=53346 RepID=UPI0015A5AEDB|nr:hypothetical protein [Enterococcus mundtii]